MGCPTVQALKALELLLVLEDQSQEWERIYLRLRALYKGPLADPRKRFKE